MSELRGLPLLSGFPPSMESGEVCRKCNKEFIKYFNPSRQCHHCGYSYCHSCTDYKALIHQGSGYTTTNVCAFCIEYLTITVAGKEHLRTIPLSQLKDYVKAYNIETHQVVEKGDLINEIVAARSSNYCLPSDNEDYYRKYSVPNPSSPPLVPSTSAPVPKRSMPRHGKFFPQPDHISPEPPLPTPPPIPEQRRSFRPDLGPKSPPSPNHPSHPHYPSSPPLVPSTSAPVPKRSTPRRRRFFPQPDHLSPKPPMPAQPSTPPPVPKRSTPRRRRFSPQPDHLSPEPPSSPPPVQSSPPPVPSVSPLPHQPRRVSTTTSVPSLNQLLGMLDPEIASLSISALKSVLHTNHVDAGMILEKSDLVLKVKGLIEDERGRLRGAEAIEKQRELSEKINRAIAERDREKAERIESMRRRLEELNRVKKEVEEYDKEMRERDRKTKTAERERTDVTEGEERDRKAKENVADGGVGPSSSSKTRPVKKDSEQVSLCVVCQDEEANIVIVDCGHLAMCMGCKENVMKGSRECPLCRTRIVTEARLVRVFKS